MGDAVYLALAVVFFVLALGLVALCARLEER